MMTTKTIDPVCGMEINPETAAGQSEFKGETVHFCSPACKEKFNAEPEKYFKPEEKPIDNKSKGANKGLTTKQATDGTHNNYSLPNSAGERVDLPITGMTCAACANRIEKQLKKQTGVDACSVNFATARATVNYNPEKTNVAALVQTVKDTGYDTAGTARAEFVVDDSARPSGSGSQLENHLSKQRGVVKSDFNLATMKVSVEYLPNNADLKQIRAAIEDFGYKVREVSGNTDSAEDSLEHAHAEEYAELQKKFWIAAVLSLPILVIVMSHGRIELFNFPGVNWLQLVLATPVVFYSGWQFYRGAWAAFRHRAADMNTLIAVGTGTAYIYSVLATIFPSFFAGASSQTMNMPGMAVTLGVPVYFE
ncbi:MAG TPA: cation transporter, partial [Pyrinomonadaceae bacterium]|nr:cation transporter [Pyrinomonadaceae bacterium]